MKYFLLVLVIVSVIFIPVKNVEASRIRPIAISNTFMNPRITVRGMNNAVIEFIAQKPMHITILKNDRLLTARIINAGYIRIIDTNYHTGDYYVTRGIFCLYVQYISCQYTETYGPFYPHANNVWVLYYKKDIL